MLVCRVYEHINMPQILCLHRHPCKQIMCSKCNKILNGFVRIKWTNAGGRARARSTHMCVNNVLSASQGKSYVDGYRLRINAIESKMNLHKMFTDAFYSKRRLIGRRRTVLIRWLSEIELNRILIASVGTICQHNKNVLCAADRKKAHVRTISIWCVPFGRFVVFVAGKNYVRHVLTLWVNRASWSCECVRFGLLIARHWHSWQWSGMKWTRFSRSHTTFVNGLAVTFCWFIHECVSTFRYRYVGQKRTHTRK